MCSLSPGKRRSDKASGRKIQVHKNKTDKKIGDSLVENKAICESDRISILLTQNRIKDEQILEAFNDLGETQIQKDAVKKRFGVLSIKKESVRFSRKYRVSLTRIFWKSFGNKNNLRKEDWILKDPGIRFSGN